MKVAYNACFGGFTLSNLACEKLTEIKGRVVGCYDFNDDKCRTDKDLINVIESLGDKASGSCANLQIKEIPCGAEFEIDEYGGSESVVPPRQSW
tara:strand:+ start:40480 stop:40761 length:282 start_codon:yes stop_codon:yes gene_type:complete